MKHLKSLITVNWLKQTSVTVYLGTVVILLLMRNGHGRTDVSYVDIM